MSKAPAGLDRGSLGTPGMSFFTISASAPMTVVAGSVIATFATTGVQGVPLSFLVLALALWPFTVGYTAMSRHVSHAGVFYAYLARGLGRVPGVAGGLVAVVSYNAIQICLYGLLGFSLANLWPAMHLAWWAWAGLAWAAVAILGILHININARVLAVLLIFEVGMILLFDIGAFTHPAGGHVSLAGLAPGNLMVTGVGGVLAFGIAAFVGYESGPVYGEEAKGAGPVARATFGALFFLGLLYAVSSLALTVTEGPGHVADAARDPASGIPFSVLSNLYGGPVAGLANLLLITSIFGALLSFHNTVARYLFAMSRERVLPAWLGRIGSGSGAGAPIGGSLLQSLSALVVFGAFAVAGANPVATLFTWLAYVAAVGILLLMVGTSLAVIGFFRKAGNLNEPAWKRTVAPVFGAVALAVVLAVTVYNSSAVLGVDPSSPLTIVLPSIIAAAAIVGALWGLVLRESRPAVYQGIGAGQTKPLAVLSHAFADVEL
jgi:amino acid transporter